MSFKKSRGSEITFTGLYCIYWGEKNLCMSGPAQLKPTLFKGQVCLWHPLTRAQELEPDLEHEHGGEDTLPPVAVTTTFKTNPSAQGGEVE